MTRMRAREFGLILGRLPPGPLNAITDVPGVSVGQVTVTEDPGHPSAIVRTGVTVVMPGGSNPFVDKVPAACHVINGFGKATGLSQIAELGELETPILLTNTLAVGAGMLGLVEHAIAANPGLRSVNAVVAECNDGWLNEITAQAVGPEHVRQAIEAAHPGPVVEGSVGAGTGMLCYGWKGGIGTASRLVPGAATASDPPGADSADRAESADRAGWVDSAVVGVLVLTNFGQAEDLCIGGIEVGRTLLPPGRPDRTPGHSGSCVVVVATSAPLDARQLGRLARRAQSGLARTGGIVEHGSGEYAIAFSARRDVLPAAGSTHADRWNRDGPELNEVFRAVVEATEEAVINSLFAATSVTGQRGRVGTALPLDRVAALLETRNGSRRTSYPRSPRTPG